MLPEKQPCLVLKKAAKRKDIPDKDAPDSKGCEKKGVSSESPEGR